MSEKKRSTLFSRLMISVALPEVIIFSIVAVISYIQLKDLFQDISKEKVENLQEELMSVIDFQDVSLATLSREIEHEAQEKMKALRYDYFQTTDSIESADLSKIRSEIGMKSSDDIYIIDQNGEIINTTFEKDLHFNLFKIDDKVFVSFLKDLFNHDFYTPEPLSIEHSTRRFKKYIYQSSKDHKYIIQLGFYLNAAERFNEEIARRLKEIEDKPNDIESIDLIVAPWQPISFYSKRDVTGEDVEVVQKIFKNKHSATFEDNNTLTSYIYFDRQDTESIKWSGVMKVVYDRNRNREILTTNLLHKISLFGVGMILLFIILFFNVKTIIKPVSNLSDIAQKLGKGELDKRSTAGGSREIAFLSASFNQMADNLEKSHQEIMKKNEEILSSINYAKRIQEAIMPPENVVKGYLDDHFIYYKPKDIVAGDFYWFEATENEIFIAAADCTGHGVPGAMVSVVCSNSLNRAVKEMKLREPAEILNKVRELVIETFERSQHDVKDGMDVCFCKIDLKTRKVTFSGAQNSLYHITKKSDVENEKLVQDDEHVLLEYKADKQPIGKFFMQKPFSQTSIECKEGDIIYLFTDGYADQFGGPNGRKFMYKPFKKLLLSLKNEPMSVQETEIDLTLSKWMGDESQIDDICVIGIRL